MQNFAPLMSEFNIVGSGSLGSSASSDICGINIEKSVMLCDHRAKLGLLSKMPFMNRLGERYINFGSIINNSAIVHTAEIHNVYSDQAAIQKINNAYRLVTTVWENIPFLWDEVGRHSEKIRARKKRVINATDHFIAITERAKNMLLLEGVDEHKITVVPVGIDIKTFKPAERDISLLRELNIPDSAHIIVSIGALHWHKGHHDLLFALGLLKSKGHIDDDVYAIIIGKGDQLNTLKSIAKRVGLDDRTRFVEHIPYDRIVSYHNVADIFYLPSISSQIWQEQFGMVFAEAMACGKTVIAGHSGSIPEVVGDAGILVTPGDYTEHAKILQDLLSSKERRNHYGELARKRAVEHFDASRFSSRLSEIYTSLL